MGKSKQRGQVANFNSHVGCKAVAYRSPKLTPAGCYLSAHLDGRSGRGAHSAQKIDVDNPGIFLARQPDGLWPNKGHEGAAMLALTLPSTPLLILTTQISGLPASRSR